ncbi:hypothetical protein Pint_30556 [Pistacia integerrima]|uniref:Uncharacterized protein n=1 Tax=Pistacia integerrima TaxID=434235 RepID=A0ACC0WYY1_9ROSI|nr:hypothetical protein Pint_30556 [Pistacia integerrima]
MGNVFSDLISATCQAIFPPCLDCTSKKVAYISELADNVNSLKNELQKLVDTKADVKRRVDIAEQRPQTQRLSELQGWKLRKLKLNFKSSYEFGKKVTNKLQDVVNLKDEGAFEMVAQEVPEPAVNLIPMQPTIGGLQSTFDKVWKYLVEEEVGIIGIYGTGGVGKTTLLKQINNKFCNALQGLNDGSWKNRSLQEKDGDIFKILRESTNPDIPQLAKVVAKECGGLPLALVTVSRAMSCKKTPQEWRYAANLLRNSASKFAAREWEISSLSPFAARDLPLPPQVGHHFSH